MNVGLNFKKSDKENIYKELLKFFGIYYYGQRIKC